MQVLILKKAVLLESKIEKKMPKIVIDLKNTK